MDAAALSGEANADEMRIQAGRAIFGSNHAAASSAASRRPGHSRPLCREADEFHPRPARDDHDDRR